MVPWTPFNHWEGPPIASLQRETLGKGGSPAVLSRSPQRHPSLPASRQRIYSKIIALTPLAILMAFSTPKQTRENYRSRFWAMEINHLLHENFGQWYDFPSGCEPNTLPGFLWSSAFVWKINWHIRRPSLSDLPRVHLLLLLSEMEVLKLWSQDILLEKACPSFPRPPRLGKPWQYSPTPQKYQSTVYSVYEQVSSSIVNICETYYK